MIILGIDPGTAIVGWAVISYKSGKIIPISYGAITTKSDLEPHLRLHQIYLNLLSIIKKAKPDALSAEEIFFATNAKTAISVGQSRGVVMLASAVTKTPFYSYSPLNVKQTICGHGKADKNQIARMVKKLCKIDKIPKPDDVTDALAIAITHAFSYKMRNIKKV